MAKRIIKTITTNSVLLGNSKIIYVGMTIEERWSILSITRVIGGLEDISNTGPLGGIGPNNPTFDIVAVDENGKNPECFAIPERAESDIELTKED